MSDKDSERRRMTARVLALLDESWRAHTLGDKEASTRAANEALELDAFCVQAVRGGIMIGEVPDPDQQPREWAEYVAAAQEAAED